MTNIREMIARAACADCEGAEYVDQAVIINHEGRVYRWEDYLSTADAVITALDAAGLSVVPKEPPQKGRRDV